MADASRDYLLDLLIKIAAPVLTSMANGQLQKTFIPELSPTWDGRPAKVAYLECFGRLMSGISPWLASNGGSAAEEKWRQDLIRAALSSYVHSVDPKSPDYLLWEGHAQALVDSAYYVQAFIRAPQTLWEPLDRSTKIRIVEKLKGLRKVSPPYSNWILFAAMNEAFLLALGEDYDPMRLMMAVRKINEWYVGDGWTQDGESFHFDYYNSFVIHPMLIQILELMLKYRAPVSNIDLPALYRAALKRTQRYSEHLERLISPQGTFPPIGRSLTYRTAAFQPLALLALRKQLSENHREGQIRAALTAVHHAIFAHSSNFNDKGFLTLGFAGHQPELADWYSNSGSMYITSEGLLMLGLPASDSFWTSPAEDWTQKQAFQNLPFKKDYHVNY